MRGLLSAWPRELGVWWHARGVATAWPHEESGDYRNIPLNIRLNMSIFLPAQY